MNTMFESGEYFVRIQNKGGHLKITIWDSREMCIRDRY